MRMKSIFKLMAITTAVLLCSCATTQERAARRAKQIEEKKAFEERVKSVSIATENMVKSCTLIDEVEIFRNRGTLIQAKKAAREKAASLGATHIVWSYLNESRKSDNMGVFSTVYLRINVNGLAYKCAE